MTDSLSLSPILKRLLAGRLHDLEQVENLLHYREIVSRGGPRGFAGGLFWNQIRKTAPLETRVIDAEAAKGAPLTDDEFEAVRKEVAEEVLAAHEAALEQRKERVARKARRLRALRAALS